MSHRKESEVTSSMLSTGDHLSSGASPATGVQSDSPSTVVLVSRCATVPAPAKGLTWTTGFCAQKWQLHHHHPKVTDMDSEATHDTVEKLGLTSLGLATLSGARRWWRAPT